MNETTKLLLLVRHAKADKPPHTDDFDRPLLEEGEDDALNIAKLLKKAEIFPELIISSPAKRAYDTAAIIAKKVKYPIKNIITNNSLYSADSEELLKFIQNQNSSINSILIAGHSPALEDCVAQILEANSFNMTTASIACFEAKNSDWQNFPKNACLKFFLTPKLAKKIT